MRAALCRVLLQETEIVLLDEPTTALDDQGAATLIDEVDRLRKAGKLLIIATHDVARLAPSAERVLLLAQGGVKADSVQTTIGTTLEQYRLVNR
jgi:energy-coupling factor transporter ATP-binding protein EcfA2